MASEITLQLPGGVQVLNAYPLDPRTFTDTLSDIVNDTTYKIGFGPIYNEEDSTLYYVSSGNSTDGWVFTEFLGNTVETADTLSEWDDSTTYDVGDYVSYINESSSDEDFQTKYIYELIATVDAGVSPEDDETNWDRIGLTLSTVTTTASDISYDNTSSELESDTIQDAIDEISVFTGLTDTPSSITSNSIYVGNSSGNALEANRYLVEYSDATDLADAGTITVDMSENRLSEEYTIADEATSFTIELSNLTVGNERMIILDNSSNTSAISTITFDDTIVWPIGEEPTGGIASASISYLILNCISSTKVRAYWEDEA